MALIVNSNLSSLNAQRHLASSEKLLNVASSRLASGKRINNAADDAAGLSISNRMTAQIRGLGQAIRNANDGISLIQTAEGALGETSNALQRIRELAIQSANGLYSDEDRTTLDAEVQQLVQEIERISRDTLFNGQAILNGALGNVNVQVGAESEQVIDLKLEKISSQTLGLNSTSGDLVGKEMALGNTGKLSNAIFAGDVLLNGQSLGDFSTDNTLGDLLDRINDDIIGVSASAVVTVEASSAGTGVLGQGQSISLSAYDARGQQLSFAITGTDSLQALADAIVSNSGGRLSAELNDQGRLVVSGEGFASISLTDSTSGSATGINQGSAGGTPDEQAVVTALQSYWISEAETLIQNAFGLVGTGVNLDLSLYTDSGSSTVASVSYSQVPGVPDFGQNLSLNINMHYFNSASLPNGGTFPMYTDRVIAHEMVHAVMTAQMDLEQLPGWFSEGIAEFIHGADERVYGDVTTGGVLDAAKIAALPLVTTSGSPSSSAGYTAGYLATRMLHDDIVASGDANGIRTLMLALAAQGVNTDFDAAIAGLGIDWGGGTGQTEFEAHFNAQKQAYLDGSYAGPNGSTSTMNIFNADTGSVVGNDVNGANPVYTAESILPNTGNAGAINFTLVVPEALGGGATSAKARLVLTSDNDQPLSIARGETGSLRDLSFLGFQEISREGNIKGFGLANPGTAWGVGDISINGVAIDPEDTDSLEGKLAAINAVSADTGVVAVSYAAGTIDMSRFNFTEWATIAGFPDFFVNGVELDGIMAATTIQGVVDVFNNVSATSGVTATLKGTNIILESEKAISFSNPSGTNTGDAFGFSNYGNARFISSADDAGGGSASAFAVGTLADRGIQLISLNGTPIQLDLDSPPAGTTGFFEVNGSSGGATGTRLASISVATQSSANRAIKAVDNALETVNDARSNLGAINNRLDFVVSNLSNVIENTAAARARIVDADFANETSALSRAQIMQQASQAMLAQANLRPQQILSLLQ